MPTTEVDHAKQITIDPSVSGALLERAQKHQKELDGRNKNNINVKPDVKADVDNDDDEWGDDPIDDGTGDKNVDTPAAKVDDPPKGDTGTEEKKIDLGIDAFVKEKKTDKQTVLNELIGDPNLKIKVPLNGRERKMNILDLNVAVERGAQFQQKYDKLSSSDEMKFGTLMAAAKSGDKEATKKVLNILKDSSKSEDMDALLDSVEKVEGNFDEEKTLKEQEAKDKEDQYFPESVINSVDYEKHLTTMKTDLRGPIPAKVFDAYHENPETRKIMYDLVAQGIHGAAMDKFYEWYDEISPTEQSRLDNDPAAWGTAFEGVFEAMKRKNKNAPKKAGTEEPAEPMDSVSDGSKGRSRKPPAAKSVHDMDSKQFAAYKAKMLNRR